MMDELRDYRFYEADMAHPNEIAIEYLWEKFAEACMDEESRKFIKDYEPIRSAMGHRVMKGGAAVKKFGNEQLERVKDLEKKYPDMSFEKEKEYFTRLCFLMIQDKSFAGERYLPSASAAFGVSALPSPALAPWVSCLDKAAARP